MMDVFDMDFMDVGDPMICGMAEEIEEENVDQMIEYVTDRYGGCLSEEQMESVLEQFDIDMNILPDFLVRRIHSHVHVS